MHVLFDCRYVRTGAHDGISRFSAELVTELSKHAAVTMLVREEAQLANLPKLPFVFAASETSVLEPFAAWRLRGIAADVLFSPMQTIGTIGKRWPVVTTIHDLIYYRHPKPPRNLPLFVRILWRLYHLSFAPQRMLLRGADAIVTVSEATKSQMRQHGLDIRPTSVIHNAARPLLPPTTAKQPASKSLVYMGSFMPYKNVDTLVAMMRELPEYTLHLASRIDDAERARLQAIAPDASLRFHNGISDDDYGALLANATALVTATRDEGFGIPVLESLAQGIPVVVSDIPILHEVAGDAGLYANPDDPSDFAARVRTLEREWAARSVAAAQQAQRFSWERSGKRLAEFLSETVERAGRRG